MRSVSQETRTDDAGRTVNNRPAFDAFMRHRNVMRYALRRLVDTLLWLTALGGLLLAATGRPALAQSSGTPAGTPIANSALIQFTHGTGVVETVTTNQVTAIVSPAPSRSTIAILRAADAPGTGTPTTSGPTQCRTGGSYVALAPPRLADGSTLNPMQPNELTGAQMIHGGEAVFVQVSDADRNLDGFAIDVVDIQLASSNGDVEVVRLSETGVNTGVFVGYIQTSAATATPNDCTLQVDRNADLSTRYVDPLNPQDASSATALVDPYGLIFDSFSGAPINGTRVRLIDALTNQPATVFGDDGVSRYPAEMTTGQQVTDSGGTVYVLPPGVFRFPLVAAGQYRLEVDPPATHSFPSSRTIGDIQASLGNSYRLNNGSYGGVFAASGPPAVAVDVPVDLLGTDLFLTKSTTTTLAAPGDFVQYTLKAQNTSTSGGLQGVSIVDRLPRGVRYRAGSTRIGTDVAPDPTISSDGETLTFAVGNLNSQQIVSLTYVAELTVQVRDKQLTNRAQAHSQSGVQSNPAQVTVRVRDDFFRDAAIIVGRVTSGTCESDPTKDSGVSGVRVYLEDGRYAITDDEGKYHFEGVPPGSHVVQMDAVSIPTEYEPALCKDRVRHAGRAYSQFVDLRGGALWRADFVLTRRQPSAGSVNLKLRSALRGDLDVQHTAGLIVAGNDLANVGIMAMLPSGLKYVPGSAQLDGQKFADPTVSDDMLIFRLGATAAGSERLLSFNTHASEDVAGAMEIKAVALFDSPSQKNLRTEPVENRLTRGTMTMERASYRFAPQFDVMKAELSARDRTQLDRLIKEWRGLRNLRVTAVGHTDKTPITPANQKLFADNYTLSHARAKVVADYLKEGLGLTDDQLTVEGKGADQPLVKGDDEASLARNRRVEIEIAGMRVTAVGKVSLLSPQGAAPEVQTQGALANIGVSHAKPEATHATTNEAGIDNLAPGVAWLAPGEHDLPAISSIKVAIQHRQEQSVELRVNDALVDALNFDGTGYNANKTVAVSRWRGVDIKDGDNLLVAVVRNADGSEAQRLERVVRFSNSAARVELAKEESSLTADGTTRPIVALRVFDASGNPARPGTQGSFSVDAPYRSWFDVESLRENQITAITPREPTFRVDDDGIARIELEPTTQTGTVTLRLRFNERSTQDLRVWLAPQARDWILVGIAEGTAAYRSISDNMEAASAADLQDGYADQGRVAFFAKGRIKGDFLLTMAYDSAREKQVDDRRLGQGIEPNRYYTVYGDGSEQRFEAPTASKVYVKLERQQFMALFGDYDSGLTVTELGRYSRTLTGVRSDFSGDRFGYTVFGASTDQGIVKDELRGDGTSGLYHLSHNSILINSDKLRIEVRDRFRSEVVVEKRLLTRFIDYSIDYLDGTIFFKEPIASRDANFNPVFIIAEYEVLQGGKEQVVAGGRASYKFGGDRAEVGTSYVQEGSENGDTRLAATDVRVKIVDGTEIRAEVARSESDSSLRAPEADAYLTEIRHVSERVEASAYFREQQGGFGFGQQLSTESATRKVGAEGRVKLSDAWAVQAEVLQQSLLGSAVERQLASAEVRRSSNSWNVGAGARHVEDSGLPGGDALSEQGFVDGSVSFFQNRLTLKAAQDMSLSGESSSVDYPSRSLIGADYKITADTAVFAEYEHAEGATFESDMTRVGMRASPWARARVTSSASQQFTEYGARTFANYGLIQGWQISDRWAMDFGVDQSKTIDSDGDTSNGTLSPFNPNVPPASGNTNLGVSNEDFLATSVAAMYRSDLWTTTTRVEHRDSTSEQRWSWTTGFYREPIHGHAFSLAAQFLSSERVTTDTLLGDLRLAWAYRPVDSRWIILNRLDLKSDRHRDSLLDIESARAVNNMNLNWQAGAHTQFGFQLGLRYVASTFDGERYAGTSSLVGFDVRRDLGSRVDIGLHGTVLNSWDASVSDAAVGLDFGINIARNMWVSVGYNYAGFFDQDYAASRYTAQGVFVRFRIKADQDTFKDLNLSSLRPGGK